MLGTARSRGNYPLSTFILACIRDIPFISTPDDLVGRRALAVIVCALD